MLLYIAVSVLFLEDYSACKRSFFCFFFVQVKFETTLKLFLNSKKHIDIIVSSRIALTNDDYLDAFIKTDY